VAKQLIALYKKPDDVDAFLQHYQDVHAPLMRKVPGLQSMEVARVEADPFGGEPAYFLVATMTFADADAFKTAMRSEENKAAGQDLMGFARGLVTLMVCETQAATIPSSSAAPG
jgi:uncharacterized protein (TIGR02118 family)